MKKTETNTRKYRMFPIAISKTVAKVTKPAMKKHGLPDGLITDWPHIAGKELAACCMPISCKRGKKDVGATLILGVSPAHSLMVQHAVGVLLEKINMHYGYALISRIQLKPMTLKTYQVEPALDPQQIEMADAFAKLANDLKNG